MKNVKFKHDIIFIAVILVLALLMWGYMRYIGTGNGDTVVVLQDGREIGHYPLSEDNIYIIAYGEEYNLLMISNGEAFVSDADCPDGLCVKQRAVSKDGESIICLPHKLVIQVEAKEEGELDAVTY
ncbi:MAG: NusG domain II-containing protein [Lachnospiraceae bacterium]|nr:NusG domain II-containing protein [Lachnospiraceae bacterium]